MHQPERAYKAARDGCNGRHILVTIFNNMIEKKDIETIIEGILKDSSIFLIEIKISKSNKISVYLDGDQGVPISECVQISRQIESMLDRDKEDFELEVSSVGLDKPLKLPRQYVKNIGRMVSLVTKDGLNINGKLMAVNENSLTIEMELPKKKKKEAQPSEPIANFEFGQLLETKVIVSFK